LPNVHEDSLMTFTTSGMGLAVASALATCGGWHLHLLDMNVERGEETAKSLGSSVKFQKSKCGNQRVPRSDLR
jgi:NAD(P)-dependent dehydrogenase (short-subunit alcohol dehydrogenase family)